MIGVFLRDEIIQCMSHIFFFFLLKKENERYIQLYSVLQDCANCQVLRLIVPKNGICAGTSVPESWPWDNKLRSYDQKDI